MLGAEDEQTLLPRLPHRATRVGDMRPPPADSQGEELWQGGKTLGRGVP